MKKCSVISLLIFSVLMITGCGNDTNTTTVVEGASKTELLNPLALQQFAVSLPIIPVATPDTTTVSGSDYYTVVAEQTSGYDFGLRKKDGSEFINPATGSPIRTTVWGYTTNGIKAGYLGATIEARSTLAGETGKQVVVKYTNNLKDATGKLLTKHLLTVDPTLDGAMGDPEVRIVTHLHGGHVAPEFDGHPEAWITNDPNAAGFTPVPPSEHPSRPAGNTVTYTYDNSQIANHLWYHDHAMGITRLNVYAGLAANYFLRDSVDDGPNGPNGLNVPKGAYEIPLVIQDKSFNADGSLHYDSAALLNPDGTQQMVDGKPVFTSNPEFFGNVITVNGKAWPKLDVEPRKYRFRILNGSDSRFYNMWLERSDGLVIPAGAITQIGNDGGLLPAAVTDIGNGPNNGLLLALAERADVIIDFSLFPAGTSITVRNDAHTPYPNGDDVNPSTTGRIMQFKISKAFDSSTPDSGAVPATPRILTPYGAPDNTRYVDLQETEEDTAFVFDPYSGAIARRLKILLNGLPFDALITENILLNDVEDWVIINNTVDMHPMHLHLVHFEVVEKGSIAAGAYTPADGAGGMPTVAPGGLRPSVNPDGTAADPDSPYTLQPQEYGHKDTVRVPPADELIGSQGYVRIRAKFDRIGTYMWHCHILAHEDHEMMRPFRVQ